MKKKMENIRCVGLYQFVSALLGMSEEIQGSQVVAVQHSQTLPESRENRSSRDLPKSSWHIQILLCRPGRGQVGQAKNLPLYNYLHLKLSLNISKHSKLDLAIEF